MASPMTLGAEVACSQKARTHLALIAFRGRRTVNTLQITVTYMELCNISSLVHEVSRCYCVCVNIHILGGYRQNHGKPEGLERAWIP